MSIFRQLIEWSILNTGVFMRERPKGKVIWSGLNLKVQLSKELAILGDETGSFSGDKSSCDSEVDDDDEDAGMQFPDKIRLQKGVCHVPVQLKSRLACRAHKQRKLTRYFCQTCKKALCLSACWLQYHTKVNYLVDQPSLKSPIIHLTPVD